MKSRPGVVSRTALIGSGSEGITPPLASLRGDRSQLREGGGHRGLSFGAGLVLSYSGVCGSGLQVAVMPDLLKREHVQTSFPTVSNDAVFCHMRITSACLNAS